MWMWNKWPTSVDVTLIYGNLCMLKIIVHHVQFLLSGYSESSFQDGVCFNWVNKPLWLTDLRIIHNDVWFECSVSLELHCIHTTHSIQFTQVQFYILYASGSSGCICQLIPEQFFILLWRKTFLLIFLFDTWMKQFHQLINMHFLFIDLGFQFMLYWAPRQIH